MLYDGESWSEYSGNAVSVRDTVGAGDGFTAALTLGLLAGWSLEKIGKFANEVAAYVCSCQGATPTLPAEFCEHFQTRLSGRCAPRNSNLCALS